MKLSDELSYRSSVGTWFNSFLNVAILYMTFEIVLLNRKNVMNSSRTANNSNKTIELLSDIKEELSK